MGVAGYRIYRDGVQVATSATNGYSDTGLAAGTTYSYTPYRRMTQPATPARSAAQYMW